MSIEPPSNTISLAVRCAQSMLEGDRPASTFGVELVRAAPGEAEVAARVGENALNAFGTCHGGILFMVADIALSFACNSHGARSVAQHCSISFVRPAMPGDRLLARAVERCRTGRTAIYDCTVLRADDGKVIAEFRGNSRTIDGLAPGA